MRQTILRVTAIQDLLSGNKFCRISVISLSMWATATSCLAQQSHLPQYDPERQVTGVIRVWGGSRLTDLLRTWEAGFKAIQPGVSFNNGLEGDDSALGGVYTGAANLALMDREPEMIEADGFEQAMGHKALGVKVSVGSLGSPDPSRPLAVFVHAGNPLTKLSLMQLEAIFSAFPRNGLRPITTWGGLGVEGPLGSHPIHLYGFGINSSEAHVFERLVFGGKQRWNCTLRGFYGDGKDETASAQTAAALVEDPDGIAISALGTSIASIHTVRIGGSGGGDYAISDEAKLRSGQYPFIHPVYFYLNRKPGAGIDPLLKEFLGFVLSREGQSLIGTQTSYLPLPEYLAKKSAEDIR